MIKLEKMHPMNNKYINISSGCTHPPTLSLIGTHAPGKSAGLGAYAPTPSGHRDARKNPWHEQEQLTKRFFKRSLLPESLSLHYLLLISMTSVPRNNNNKPFNLYNYGLKFRNSLIPYYLNHSLLELYLVV